MTSALLIVHEKCNQPSVEDAWIRWHRDTHEADLRNALGAHHVTFWQLAQKPEPGMPGLGFSHVTIVELDADSEPAFGDLLAKLRADGKVHAAHTVMDAQFYVAHGRYNEKKPPSDELRGHILAHVLPNDPAVEREWDQWYDEQHMPDMMASDAFSGVTRWRREPRRPVGPNHITLYDVSLHSIDEAVKRSAAVMPGIVAAGRKHPAATGALTLTLVRVPDPA
ncbi:MAG TPA: hypothetical protein VF183_13890 [Acidimicrobiales bacterium]